MFGTAYLDTCLVFADVSGETVAIGLAVNIITCVTRANCEITALCICDAINLDALVFLTFAIAILLVTVVMTSTINFFAFVGFVVTELFGFWTMVVGSAFVWDTFIAVVDDISLGIKLLLGFTSAFTVLAAGN